MAAHLTREQARGRDLEHHWEGNDKADYWAKEALDSTGKEGKAYIAVQKTLHPSAANLQHDQRD